MKGQELKILFKEDLSFLTEEVALDFNQVQISDSLVKFKAPAYWTIRVINHIEKERKLFVEVLSYHVGETKFPSNQIELADILMSIEKVTFKSIDTAGLLRTLNGNEPFMIMHPKPQTFYRSEIPTQADTIVEVKPVLKIYDEHFSIPIKNVRFLSGKVEFEKRYSSSISQLNLRS
jgi:hypothetical protein